jgi:hypothetical protein
MITITLNKIRACDPCEDVWKTLLKSKGVSADYDAEFPLTDVIESNGLDDALWCVRCLPEYNRLWRKYAVWCARQVEHLMVDQRSHYALDVAGRHADGMATDAELAAARAAASAAVCAAVCAAVWATMDARDAARAASAASAAASAASAAVWAAMDAELAAAWDARAAARDTQKKKLIEILTGDWND